MAVKIRLASEFDPRGFDAAEQRLLKLKDKSMANSKTIEGSWMRAGAGVVGFGDKMSAAGTTISNTGDSLTKGVTLPLVGIGAMAFKTAADFEQTMNMMQAASGASGEEMKQLEQLAKKFGAETVFSANDAAQATLELAKAGLTPAAISAGALEAAMQLAAAGGLSMEESATVAANAINTFSLEASDAASVADALAGGANASSADVNTLQQALAQAGTVANAADLSLQDTVGTLALFADRGIQGSDAGTSLKTMLSRLIPQTDKAAKAMEKYGLSFVDAEGNYKNITEISQILQDKLGGLSAAERDAAIQTIFGSDAKRAALLTMQAGEEGLQKYIDATADASAAEKMAEASMSGAKGAIEAMTGSMETAGLAIGQALSPTVINLSEKIGALADKFGSLDEKTQQNIVKYGLWAAAAGPVLAIGGRIINMLGGMVQGLGHAIVGTGRFIGGLRGASGAASTFAGRLGMNTAKLAAWAKTAAVSAVNAARKFGVAIAQGAVAVGNQIKQMAISTALWIKDTAAKVGNTAATVAHAVAQGAVAVATKVWTAAQWLLNAALTANPIGLVVAAIGLLVGAIVIAWKSSDKFRQVVTKAWQGIKTATVNAFNSVVDFLKKWGPRILIALGGPTVWAVALIVKNWDKIKNATKTAFEAVKNAVKNAFEAVKNAVKNGVSNVVNFMKELPGKMLAAVGNLAQLLYQSGKDLISGFINGIKSKIEDLKNAVRNFASNAVSSVKGFLGIQSPSTVFHAIGADTGQGMANGLASKSEDVKNASKGLAESALEGTNGVAQAAQDAMHKMVDAEIASLTAKQSVKDAQQAYNDAVKQFGKNSDEARLKLLELNKAQGDAANKQQEFKKWTDHVNHGMSGLRWQVHNLNSSKPGQAAFKTGSDTAKGLADGIKSGSKGVEREAQHLTTHGVTQQMNSSLQTHSPSRVTMRIGQFAAQGLANGLRNGKGGVSGASGTLSSAISRAFSGLKPAMGKSASDAVTLAQGLPGRIRASFPKVGSLLSSAGSSIMGSLVSSMKRKWEEGKRFIGGIATWIKNNKGPEKKDRVLLVKNGRAIMAGLQKGLGAGWKLAQRDIKKYTASLKKDAGKEYKSTAEVIIKQAKRLAEKMREAYRKLSSAKNKTAVNKITSDYKRAIESAMKAASDAVTKQADKLAEKLKDAVQKLKDAQQKLKDYANGIKDTFKSFGTLSSIEKPVSAQSYIDELQKRKDAAAKFAADIEKLRAMGLKKGAIDDILAQGVEEGGRTASILASGTQEQIAQINALQSSIASTGSALGNQLAKDYYQAGVDAAQGIVNGLNAQKNQLIEIAGWIGQTLVDAIRKKLNIKSPSRVMGELGSFAGEGFVDGFGKWARDAADTASTMAGAVSDNLVPKLPALPAIDAGFAAPQQKQAPQVVNNYNNTYYTIDGINVDANDTAMQEAIKKFFNEVRRIKRMQPQGGF